MTTYAQVKTALEFMNSFGVDEQEMERQFELFLRSEKHAIEKIIQQESIQQQCTCGSESK